VNRFSVFQNQKNRSVRRGVHVSLCHENGSASSDLIDSAMLRLLSWFLRAPFQFSKRAAGEATKFGRSGVKLLGVVGAARLECGEPAAESGELIRRQLGNSFGDFFDFHGAQLTSLNLYEISALNSSSECLFELDKLGFSQRANFVRVN
jgi:hypothetical protein